MAAAHPQDTEPVYDNSGDVPLRVPGFGLALDHPSKNIYMDDNRFRDGTNDFRAERMTVREVAMVRLMDSITDKPDWHRKVFDEGILRKWHDEATSLPDGMISEKAFDWCITELRDRAADYEKDGLVRTLEGGGSRCVKSDIAIPEALKTELKEAVRPLFNVKSSERDWHPGTNDVVLNLVHPSLYPLVYGRTRVLQTGRVGLENCYESFGAGQVAIGDQYIPEPLHEPGWNRSNATFFSKKFQWLPADVKFKGDDDRTAVEITSYINNLPPLPNQKMYNVIEALIAKAIPAWNEVLIKKRRRFDVRIRTLGAEVEPPNPPELENIEDDEDPSSEEHQRKLEKLREYLRLPDNPDYLRGNPYDQGAPTDWETTPFHEWTGGDYHRSWNVYNTVQWKWERVREVVHPEPGDSYSYDEWKSGATKTYVVPSRFPEYGSPTCIPQDSYLVQLEEQFRSKGLQIIVKLASIELSPEKPSYPGGGWHLEGMRNEHIVATAIYYYDVENCQPSRLRFRQEARLDDLALNYEQDDHDPLERVFGAESMRDAPAVQETGSIDTREGRLLVFPNTLQHKVEPFELLDSSKPGHRRFIVLWLVDPHYRIASTANVPPQQSDWWMRHLRSEDWNRNLPQEIKDEIMEYAKEGVMSLSEAKELRLELMKERTAFGDTVEQNFEHYNLCEH